MDSAVNINLPSSRQPRRRVSAPRPRSRLRWPPCPSPLERLAHSGAPGSRRPSPAARRSPLRRRRLKHCATPTQPARQSLRGPARPRQESPKRRRGRALKRPGRLHRKMGSSRLGAGLAGQEKEKPKRLDGGERGGEIPLLRLFQSPCPQPYKLLTSSVS